MKKKLLLSTVALAISIGYASARVFVAQELNGQFIRITNNVNTSSHISTSGDHLATTTSTDTKLTAWHVEYDAIQDGIILSQNGKYMGCIPATKEDGAINNNIPCTTNKAKAGRYRFYIDDDNNYCLTTTKLDNGTNTPNIGQFGQAGDVSGFWVNGGKSEGEINRWGTGAGTAHWTYALLDEVELEVTIGEGGSGILQNWYNYAWREQQGYNKRWISNYTPVLEIIADANNIAPADNNIGLAPGAGCNYTITYDDPSWYVAKVEFDFIASADAIANNRFATFTADNNTLTTSATESQHFSIERSYGQTASFHEGGGNAAANTSNFIVTLHKVTKQNLASTLPAQIALMEGYKELYSHYPDIWDASVIDGVIAEFSTDANIPDWITPEVVANYSADKAIKAVNATANEKTVQLRNMMHSNRYLSIGTNAGGNFVAHTTDNTDNLQTVWTLIYDSETNGFRLSNSLTDEMEIGHIQAIENPVPMTEAGAGHIYEINPVYVDYTANNVHYNDYIVEIWDRNNSGQNYLHCGGQSTNQVPEGGQRVVKWNSASSGAAASGWFISEMVIENQLDAIKALEGQDVVITKIIDGANNPYLTIPSGSESATFSDNLRPTSIWRISVSNINKVQSTATIALQNLLSGKWTTDLTSLSATRPTTSTLKIDDVAEMLETWHIINTAATPNETLGTFSIKAITDEQKEAMVADLHAFYNQTISQEPGLPSFDSDEVYQLYLTNKEAANGINIENGIDYAAINSLFEFADNNVPAKFNLNAIAGPALIRMAYTPNNATDIHSAFNTSTDWIGHGKLTDSNYAGDKSLAFTNGDPSIFVLADRKLYSLNTGHGVIVRGNVPSMHTDEDDLDLNLSALETDFTDTQKTALVDVGDGIRRQGYTIRVNDAAHHTFGASSTGGPHVGGFGTPTYPSAQANWAYTVWYVKELPVELGKGESYKLWRTPVAVAYEGEGTAPAYSVSVSGWNVTTLPVENNKVYGAGTIFILTDNVTFAVKNGVNIQAEQAGIGDHILKSHSISAESLYLTIHADAHSAAPAQARARYSNEAQIPVLKMAVEAPAADGEAVIPAHEARIVVPKDESAHSAVINAGYVNLGLGATTDTTNGTTGIEEVATKADASATVVYDLQGRKLAAPVKGINIINGKKTLIRR